MTIMKNLERANDKDLSVRAMTDDGAFRVIVARTSSTVQGITSAQHTTGETARTLGDLLTATVLFRETMSPNLRVQGILRDRGGLGTLIADSAPLGHTRGLAQAPPTERSRDPRANDRLLQMMRTLPNGSINQGIVRIGNEDGVSKGMMSYMKDSEQVDTMLAVGTILDEKGDVRTAGGYMVQLLPEVGRAPLAIMAQRLEDFPNIEELLTADFSPEHLRDELLYGMPFAKLDSSPVSFECWCSENRLLGALATLNKSEIQAMIDDAKPIEIACDYCLKEYVIQPNRLNGLLEKN